MRRALGAALSWLGRIPRPLLVAISLLLVGLIALASYETPVEIRFSFFYLLPISLNAWFAGRRAGVLFSFLSAGAWLTEFLLEQRHTASEVEVAYWNTGLLLSFYLVLAVLLSTLSRVLEREKIAARADPLTHIPNRRAFFELAEAEIQRVSRYGGRFTVAYMDLDNFKQVNDRDGHETGDRVLRQVAEAIRKSLRVNDIVARVGGDEFIVLLPEAGAQEAETVVRKLENHLTELMRQGGWAVTLSTGAVTFEKPPDSVDQMVKLADELMYSVKTSGKNRLAKRTIGT